MNNLKVCWLSGGLSSFIAGLLAGDIDEWIYIDIKDQHPDTLRFIHDCENALGFKATILKSNQYSCVNDCVREKRFFNIKGVSPCTNLLKKRVRKEWEYKHRNFNITYVWGFDCDEIKRADRLEEAMPDFNHEFPLIKHHFTKADVHGYFINHFSFNRPMMYNIGYPNNNCIGCLKGGLGYWNMIRIDFPEVFEERSKLEQELDCSILKYKGEPLFLKDLKPELGNMQLEVFPDCSIFCQFPEVTFNE